MEKNLSRNGEINSEALLSTNEEQEPLVIRLRLLNYRICQMSTKANKTLALPSLDPESAELLSGLIQSGGTMNDEFQTWEAEAYKLYQYHTFNMTEFWQNDIPRGTQGAAKLYTYNALSVACLWNNYRTSRNYLLRLLIRISARLSSEESSFPMSKPTEDSTIELRNQSLALADDVCASVPYVLGEVDEDANLQDPRRSKAVGGLFLLWPLGSLLHLDYLPPEQITWIKERVAYIRDALGIHQARAILNLADH